MQTNYLKEAMAKAEVDKLPEPSTKRFEGLAVAKVKKVGNKQVYVACHFDDDLKKVLVAHDFCRGQIEEIIEVYPDPKRIKLSAKEILDGLKDRLVEEGYEPEKVKGWNTDKCKKELELVIRTKEELVNMGIPSPKGDLDELLDMKKKFEIPGKDKAKKQAPKKEEPKSDDTEKKGD